MESFDFGRKCLMGIVFDVSDAHDKSGGRIIDILKAKLVKKIADSDENLLAVVSSENAHVPRLCGGGIQQIDNYEDKISFRVGEETRRISSIVGESVEDADKIIVLFTDRFNPKYKNHYKAIVDVKKNKNYDYKIVFVALNDMVEFCALKEICEQYDCIFIHVHEMKLFDELFNQIGVNCG